ncbi:DUF262 domain-containing protein [Lactococcus protaetiae]|uniref:DUF262 domain-containing protein n=1 Tax=Lactococcus protaetiae TaxID=2592653 RepID=A0A514Z5M1_9LACT|nr:DUF262 domain-containing protein [Lactococcus protaetiae]QDK69895.1 DUF262 domain-containing protein [Lactococcus protaetiae]
MANLKQTKIYNINDFLEWYDKGQLEMSPKYQRNSVWNSKAESYLIDTILRDLPIPLVFIRQTVDMSLRKTFREVIDGQQRLRAIIKFANDEFGVMKIHNQEFSELKFSELPEQVREEFLNYQVPVELITTKDDDLIYDMFTRMNTNSYVLTKQELRNANYRGFLKVMVYSIASERRKFFIENHIFSDNELLRMVDAEYISMLVGALLEGIRTDNPSNLDKLYKTYDSAFSNYEEILSRFNTVFNKIEMLLSDNTINVRKFRNKNYFYTLFCYLTLGLFGLENYNKQSRIVTSELGLKSGINEIEAQISVDDESKQTIIREFEKLHSNGTRQAATREKRLEILIYEMDSLSNG